MTPTRHTLREVFDGTDAEVARGIDAQKLHRGTALFVMKALALELEKNGLEEVVATRTEAAVKPVGGYGG